MEDIPFSFCLSKRRKEPKYFKSLSVFHVWKLYGLVAPALKLPWLFNPGVTLPQRSAQTHFVVGVCKY